MERSPSKAKTCLARARRERGQKRVPLPPARITGRKSIGFDIAETSYRTNTRFAQREMKLFLEGNRGCAAPPLLETVFPHPTWQNGARGNLSRKARLGQLGQEFRHAAGALV